MAELSDEDRAHGLTLDLEGNTVLPCGCKMRTGLVRGEPTMLYEPCSLTCQYYLFTIRESAQQGNQITHREK